MLIRETDKNFPVSGVKLQPKKVVVWNVRFLNSRALDNLAGAIGDAISWLGGTIGLNMADGTLDKTASWQRVLLLSSY